MPKEPRKPTVPATRTETHREALRAELLAAPVTARELSSRVGLSEKDVVEHLEQLVKSARARGEKLRIEPAVCDRCGFVFESRDRLTRPSRCPECKGERIRAPMFSID